MFRVYKKMVGGIDVLELIRRWWVGLMFRVNKKMVGEMMFRVYKKMLGGIDV